jgi:predicted TPR repeat methyltransferase
MKFVLTVDIGNDAMRYAGDLSELLAHVARKLDSGGPLEPCHTQTVRDFNGNRVGGWKITEED